jgi:hypothetical protein
MIGIQEVFSLTCMEATATDQPAGSGNGQRHPSQLYDHTDLRYSLVKKLPQ